MGGFGTLNVPSRSERRREIVDFEVTAAVAGPATIYAASTPYVATLAFAVEVRVDPVDAPRSAHLRLSVADDEGNPVGAPLHQTIPIVAGSQRDPKTNVVVETTWELTLPRYGGYVITVELEGQPASARTVAFDVKPLISEEEMNVFDEEMGLI
jgi:hypothetical protein